MSFWLCVINTTIIFSAKLLRADRVFATLVKVLKNCMELEDEPYACERGGCRAHPNGSPNEVRVHLAASCDPSDHPRTRALARSACRRQRQPEKTCIYLQVSLEQTSTAKWVGYC